MGRKSREAKDEIETIVESDNDKLNKKILDIVASKESAAETGFRRDILDFLKKDLAIIENTNSLVDEIEKIARARILEDPESKTEHVLALLKISTENRNDLLKSLVKLFADTGKESVNINIGTSSSFKEPKKEDIQKASKLIDFMENMMHVQEQEQSDDPDDEE